MARHEDGELPFVDEHRTTIAASRTVVWIALDRFVDAFLAREGVNPLARLLGTEPRRGFEIVTVLPGEQLVLAGRHRFSRYRLVFELDAVTAEETGLSARTLAEFPGPAGRVYRTLVVGSGAHAVVVTRVLGAIGSHACRAEPRDKTDES